MRIYCGLLLLISLQGSAQGKVVTTSNLKVTGEVKTTQVFSIYQLEQLSSISIDSFVVYNHLMEKRGVIRNIEGVRVKEILSQVEILSESPKKLSEYYFVFIASDNYSVVYSWNEIFNSPTGENIFIVTEKEGKKMQDQDDAISVLCTSDKATGRRYVKGLQEISVRHIDQAE